MRRLNKPLPPSLVPHVWNTLCGRAEADAPRCDGLSSAARSWSSLEAKSPAATLAFARARIEGKRLGRPPIASALEKRIREVWRLLGDLAYERFGVNPSTVQRISRPFDGASVAVA